VPELGPQPLNPEEDPAFLAFLRAQGVEESELRSAIATRLGNIQRELARQLPRIGEQEQEAIQRVADAYENRGLYRSGARLVDQARMQREYGYRRSDLERAAMDEQTALAQQLAQQVAAMRRRQAEEDLATRSRLAIGYAGGGAV
jgi:hypothetical protein